MVTGSSKVWVGIDNQPIELKKSNDGSLELNEWECICAADALNVGDYCFGAPLISCDFTSSMFDYERPTKITMTAAGPVLTYEVRYYQFYTLIINLNNPMHSTIGEYNYLGHYGSRNNTVDMIVDVVPGGAIKVTDRRSGQNITNYYDIRSGRHVTISESEYNQLAAVTPVLSGLSMYGTMFHNTSAYSESYGLQSAMLYTTGPTPNIQGHVMLSGTDSTYCDYTPLLYTSDSILIFVQETDTSNMQSRLLQYAVKFSDKVFIAGPKQAVPINSTGQITSPFSGNNTCATFYGIVTAKIDSTHVIVAG